MAVGWHARMAAKPLAMNPPLTVLASDTCSQALRTLALQSVRVWQRSASDGRHVDFVHILTHE